jgi:hypothetical protein
MEGNKARTGFPKKRKDEKGTQLKGKKKNSHLKQ